MEKELTFENIIGKVILIGLTYMDHNERILSQEQYHGVIISASEKTIRIQTKNGEIRTIPPQLSNIRVAEPGIYSAKSTGEVINDPDLISYWSLYKRD